MTSYSKLGLAAAGSWCALLFRMFNPLKQVSLPLLIVSSEPNEAPQVASPGPACLVHPGWRCVCLLSGQAEFGEGHHIWQHGYTWWRQRARRAAEHCLHVADDTRVGSVWRAHRLLGALTLGLVTVYVSCSAHSQHLDPRLSTRISACSAPSSECTEQCDAV